jgi:hypothetical protein
VADEKDAGERAKELLVYGPIGLALYLRDTAPSFLRLFVARGRNELEQRRREVGDQLDQARAAGESATTSSAPQVLRFLSEGVTQLRGRAEEALEALGVTGADGGPGPASPGPDRAPVVGSRLAIADYDDLSASQVVDRLEGLSPGELEAIRAHESSHRARNTILGKIEQLTRGS